MIEVRIDASQVAALAAELSGAPARVVPAAVAAVAASAASVQRGMRSQARSSTHFGQLAATITADVRGLSAEIGPEHRGAGDLANIYYFGTSRGGGSGDLTGPLSREAPKLELALSAAGQAAALRKK